MLNHLKVEKNDGTGMTARRITTFQVDLGQDPVTGPWWLLVLLLLPVTPA